VLEGFSAAKFFGREFDCSRRLQHKTAECKLTIKGCFKYLQNLLSMPLLFKVHQDLDSKVSASSEIQRKTGKDLLNLIQSSMIGDGIEITTPFGPRPLVYCDWVASGRALSFIEQSLLKDVLPFYGNTHTTSSLVSFQFLIVF
jgi:hypothetical protein